MTVNKVILIGNLGKDPDVRTTQVGKEVVTFSVATTESWKDKTTGERQNKTEWHNIVSFNENLNKVIKDYVTKGSKVYLEGALRTRKYTGKDEIERSVTEIILENFNGTLKLLDSKKDSEISSTKKSLPSFAAELEDDEIPF
jgi:single-strand DNA-binding protein